MKKSFLQIILIALCIFTTSNTLFAQGDPSEEIQQMMDEINSMMRGIEQKLAKVALEPEELASIFRQLRTAVDTGRPEIIPDVIREYLTNNLNVLAELINPKSTEEEARDIRRMLRRELQVDDGLNQVIKKYPQILSNLMLREDLLKESLQKHLKIENDLKSIFDMTEKEMIQTEDKLKELIKLATQLQQKMNSDAQDRQDEEQQDEEEQGDEGPPENPNEKENPDPAKDNYAPESSKEADGGKSRTDPFAWGNPLPKRDIENAREARESRRPKNYDDEADFYFRELAKEDRRLRELEKSTPDKSDSTDK